MKKKEFTQNNQNDNGPPIFRTWNQMYAMVLVLHALIILAFYIFTKIYS